MARSNDVVSDPAIAEAISTVRNGQLDWAVVGFTSEETQQLELVDSGRGNVDAFRHLFIAARSRFALLRQTHQQSGLPQTKFILISWTPHDLRPMRKARLSTLRGKVQGIVGSFHVSVDWSEPSDISSSDIGDRVARASGTRVAVTTAAAAIAAQERAEACASRAPKARVPAVPKASRQDAVSFVPALKAAIDQVRDDGSGVDWVLATHESATSIGNVQTGTGGVDALLNELQDDLVTYALFRMNQTIDQSHLVKFVFVALMPASVSAVKRARHATHRGLVLTQFQPFHYEFAVASKSELSRERVVAHIEEMTGTRSRVRENVVKVEVTKAPDAAKRFVDPSKKNITDSARLQFVDEESVRAAIRSVHADKDETNWTLIMLNSKYALEKLGSGSGGASEMMAASQAGQVNIGLLRVQEKIDGHNTIKFALVVLQPADVKPIARARVSTMLGSIKEVFEPFHVDLFVNSAAEVSDDIVKTRVSDASGSRSKVLDETVDDAIIC